MSGIIALVIAVFLVSRQVRLQAALVAAFVLEILISVAGRPTATETGFVPILLALAVVYLVRNAPWSPQIRSVSGFLSILVGFFLLTGVALQGVASIGHQEAIVGFLQKEWFVVLFSALLEEYQFRYLLQDSLVQPSPTGQLIPLSGLAVIFSLVHGFPYGILDFDLIVGGLVFSIIRIKTGGLFWPVFVHASSNLVKIFLVQFS